MDWRISVGALILIGILVAVKKKLRLKLLRGTQNYGKAAYWDSRYRRHPGTYEWYVSFEDLLTKGALSRELLNIPNLRYLDIGCGNSDMGEKMRRVGANVISCDFSDTCIAQMRQKYPASAKSYIFADLTDLEFKANSFDYIVDKGTMDAILANKEAAAVYSVGRVARQLARVLRKKTGLFLMITCSSAESWYENMKGVFEVYSESTFTVPNSATGTVLKIYAIRWRVRMTNKL